MTGHLIRVDGTQEDLDLGSASGAMRRITKLIGAPMALDTVNLRDGRVMIVDDTGMVDGKPVNPLATIIYHKLYRTPNSIHGDVVICIDEDFA